MLSTSICILDSIPDEILACIFYEMLGLYSRERNPADAAGIIRVNKRTHVSSCLGHLIAYLSTPVEHCNVSALV
jgi:hypothetical protein